MGHPPHDVINHTEKYVRGRVHTNGIENFWSLLKRGIGGTYVAVEPFHLDRYVDEQVFRYNNRATSNNPMTDAGPIQLGSDKYCGEACNLQGTHWEGLRNGFLALFAESVARRSASRIALLALFFSI